jgi:hypothetical protein
MGGGERGAREVGRCGEASERRRGHGGSSRSEGKLGQGTPRVAGRKAPAAQSEDERSDERGSDSVESCKGLECEDSGHGSNAWLRRGVVRRHGEADEAADGHGGKCRHDGTLGRV